MIKYSGCFVALLVVNSSVSLAGEGLFDTVSSNPVLINLNSQGDNRMDRRGKYFKPRLQPTDRNTRKAILNYERNNQTKNTPGLTALARCSLVGSRIELDNRSNTLEQVVTFDKNCQSSPNRLKTVWFVQSSSSSGHKVLMSERASLLRIPEWRKGGFRAIEAKASSKLSIGAEKKQHEASCLTVWQRVGSHYRADPEIIQIWGRDAMSPGFAAWYDLHDLYPHLKNGLPTECPKN